MKANETNKINVMKLQSELNNALKEEHKSFSSLVKFIKGFEGKKVMNDYLNASNLTLEQLTTLDYFKGALTYATFEGANGSYTTIARKDYKTGEMKPAKWSFWLILNAARKVRKEELKAAQKAAKEAKEQSLAAIEAEEKKAAKVKGSKAKESK